MRFATQTIRRALRHLRHADPVMGALIARAGPFRLQPERDRFGMLVRSIISQQISTKAAIAIRNRLEAAMAPRRLSAENVLDLSAKQLRSAGLSAQKAAYLIDLSERVGDARLQLNRIGRLSDENVIGELVQVKGIGVWTAQMFLIFSLGRLDVFPHGDLGVRTAIRDLYELDELPDRETSHHIARPWRPYATVASWYCWRNGNQRQQQRRNGADSAGYPV